MAKEAHKQLQIIDIINNLCTDCPHRQVSIGFNQVLKCVSDCWIVKTLNELKDK